MLPWLIGAAVVGAVGYLASDDDDSSSRDYDDECRYCSREEYIDGLCERHYREREDEREQKRNVESEIESYKQLSGKQISDKYGVELNFDGESVSMSSGEYGKLGNLKEHIAQLKTENAQIQKLVDELEKEKDAV